MTFMSKLSNLRGNAAGRTCPNHKDLPARPIGPGKSPYHLLLKPLTQSRLKKCLKNLLRREVEPPQNPRNIVADWDSFFVRSGTPQPPEASALPIAPRPVSTTWSEVRRDYMLYDNHFFPGHTSQTPSTDSWATTLENGLIEPCPSGRRWQADDSGDLPTNSSPPIDSTYSRHVQDFGPAHNDSKGLFNTPSPVPMNNASPGSITPGINLFRDYWANQDSRSTAPSQANASPTRPDSPVSPMSPGSIASIGRPGSPVSPISPNSNVYLSRPDSPSSCLRTDSHRPTPTDLFYQLFWDQDAPKTQYEDASAARPSPTHPTPSPTSPHPMGLFFQLFWRNDAQNRVNSTPELSGGSGSTDTDSLAAITNWFAINSDDPNGDPPPFGIAARPTTPVSHSCSPTDPFLSPADAPGGPGRLLEYMLPPPLVPTVRDTSSPVRPPRPPSLPCPPPTPSSPLEGAPPYMVTAANEAILRNYIQRLWGSRPDFHQQESAWETLSQRSNN